MEKTRECTFVRCWYVGRPFDETRKYDEPVGQDTTLPFFSAATCLGEYFKQTLYLSKIYEAVENLEMVENVYVRQFYSLDPGKEDKQEEDITKDKIAKDGVIALGENEIPVLGNLTVGVTGGVS